MVTQNPLPALRATKRTLYGPNEYGAISSLTQDIELEIAEVVKLMNLPLSPVDMFSAENKDDVIIQAGMPCSLHPSGIGLLKAKSNCENFWTFGIASQPISPTFAGNIHTNGRFNLLDWTNVTGMVNLIAKAIYYLAPTGGLTINPPTTPGYILQQIGVVIAPNTLNIQIGQPILL